MAINLKKGQTINLRKEEHDLSRVTIGLGWDIQPEPKRGFFSLFKSPPSDFDLDAVAVLLDQNGKILERGNERLQGGDVIFFNNLKHRSGYLWHTGDNLTGQGEGDDEQIIVNLERMYPQFHRILFLVSIYQGMSKSQHFGLLENAYIRAVDAQSKEILRFQLDQAPEYQDMCTMCFGEVYRQDSGWKFRALGEAYPDDSFLPIIKRYF
ncbi:MAG: TerD family protein [Candidatus Sericytochromatia bacterium]|nr:TerD family protein [Candidatus Sericytochromatia bacterium]